MVWAGIPQQAVALPLTPLNKPEMKASDLKHPGKILKNLLSLLTAVPFPPELSAVPLVAWNFQSPRRLGLLGRGDVWEVGAGTAAQRSI